MYVGQKVHDHFKSLRFARSALTGEQNTLILALIFERLISQICETISDEKKLYK